jgi:transcriptional regulator PpsR
VTQRPPQAADLAALSRLAPELAAAVVSVSGDIALVIDGDGVIRNVALGADPALPAAGDWVGRRWVDTVTGETRAKVEQLLDEVRSSGIARQRREINHRAASGPDLPMAYAAVRLGERGPVLAVGRDLRAIAAIQQRFVESQQEMERDYWRRRQAESRYRLLFQVATDAVLMVDGLTMNVVEANRAAGELFALPLEALVEHPMAAVVAPASRPAVEELLATARATGKPAEIRVRASATQAPIDISATPFRAESALLLLVRARAVRTAADGAGGSPFAELVQRTPDGVLVTDASGRILAANPALLELFELASEAAMQGRQIGDWVLDDGIESTLRLVRRHGIASQLRATVRGSRGREVEVEVSAALLDDGEQERIGFTLRRLAARGGNGVRPDHLAAAIEALALDGDGRLALPALVQAAAQLIERHLLEAALTGARGDHRAAAGTLGIPLDDLQARLDRHGLAALPPTLN